MKLLDAVKNVTAKKPDAPKPADPAKPAPAAPPSNATATRDLVHLNQREKEKGQKSNFNGNAMYANFAGAFAAEAPAPQIEKRNPDGSLERRYKNNNAEVVEYEKDGKIQRVTTDVTHPQGSMKDVTGRDYPGWSSERPVEVKHTRVTSVDKATGKETPVLEARRTSQEAAVEDVENLPPGTRLDPSSRQVVSETEVTQYGPDGTAARKQKTYGFETTVKGDVEGRPVSIQKNEIHDAEGKPLREDAEYKGFMRNELKNNFKVRGGVRGYSIQTKTGKGDDAENPITHLDKSYDGQANEFIGDQHPVDVTITKGPEGQSLTFDTQKPNGDKRSVTRLDPPEGKGPVTWTYGESTNNGKHVASQTVREGDPNFSATTVIDKQDNGSVRVQQDVHGSDKDGKKMHILHSDSKHTRLEKPEDVDRALDQERNLNDKEKARLRAELKKQIAEGKPVFLDTAEERFTRPDWDGAPNGSILGSNRKSTTYSGEGVTSTYEKSDVEAKLRDGSRSHLFRESQSHADRNSDEPLRATVKTSVDPNFSESRRYSFSQDRNGEIRESRPGDGVSDADKARMEELTEMFDRTLPGRQQTQDALNNLLAPAGSVAGNVPGALEGVKGSEAFAAFGVGTGAAQLLHGLQEQDAAKIANGASGTLNGLGALGESRFLAGTAAADILKSGGIVGNTLQIGTGAYQFVTGADSGDKIKGGLDITAGALGIAGAVSGVPGLNVAALAVAGAAFGYDFLRNEINRNNPGPIDRSIFPG